MFSQAEMEITFKTDLIDAKLGGEKMKPKQTWLSLLLCYSKSHKYINGNDFHGLLLFLYMICGVAAAPDTHFIFGFWYLHLLFAMHGVW